MGYINYYVDPEPEGEGTYRISNPGIGLIADKILEVCPFAEIYSDTGGDSTIAREIYIKFGNSNFLLRLQAGGSSFNAVILYGVDGSQLGSSMYRPAIPGYVLMLYSSKVLTLWAAQTNNQARLAFFKDTDDNVLACACSSTTNFAPHDRDIELRLTGVYSSLLLQESTSKRMLVPGRLIKGENIAENAFDDNFFLGSIPTNHTGISVDENGNYYHALTTGARGIVFRD